ncbi:glycosyltransferase family 2 protein [Candidatus Woesearchaeota archaeon]|nr:glycosyltransferase family 2 protein [Candidatus Woesearchaeota archaeon]
MVAELVFEGFLWFAYFVSLYFSVFWLLAMLDRKDSGSRVLPRLPSVSIVVPAYNESENIRSTLDSLVALNYPEGALEISVVDDGSTDGTAKIVEEFIASNPKRRIRLIRKSNGGKGSALNVGLSSSSSDLFVCMDADSIVSRDALLKIIPHFHDGAVAVVLPLLKVYRPANLIQRMQWFEYLVNLLYKRVMSSLDCVHVAPGPFSVYRRSVLVEVGGFDESNLTEDLEIALRIQEHDYRIVQLLDAEVYTRAPERLGELYRQRNRWYKGAIINAVEYRHMVFNPRYGDFGFIQLPLVMVSGLVALILTASFFYYFLKPYIMVIYDSFFIGFDFYTLIRTFTFDFSVMDIDYTKMFIALVMFSIAVYVMVKAFAETGERLPIKKFFSLLAYMLVFFLFIGFVWAGVVFDLLFRRRQKW